MEQPSQPEGVLSAFAAFSLDPPPGPSSPIQSSYSTGPFSLREESSDNATDLDSWAAESDNSGSDDDEINDVIQMLDIRLISVLGGDLDLAARLIPKIHDLLDSDLDAGIPNFSKPIDQDTQVIKEVGAPRVSKELREGLHLRLLIKTHLSAPRHKSMAVPLKIRTNVGMAAIPTKDPGENLIGIQI
jgi:hypothetical protein